METRSASKEVLKLPKKIAFLYFQLVNDLSDEGPYPHGWEVAPLKGREELRIKITREYRVIAQVVAPNIIVIRVAHRKEVYE